MGTGGAMKTVWGVIFGIVFAGSAFATVTLPCGNGGSDADAIAFCKSYAEAGHAVAVCGGFIDNDVEARASAICNAALASCRQGDLYLAVKTSMEACAQAQHMSAAATLTAGDTAVACGNAAQTCGDVAVNCPTPPPCPDVSVIPNLITCKKVKHKKDGSVVGRYCKAVVGVN